MWWLRATHNFSTAREKVVCSAVRIYNQSARKKEQEKLLRYYIDVDKEKKKKESLKFPISTSKWWLHISTFHKKSSINWTMAWHSKLCWSFSASFLQIAAICELQIYAGAEKPIKLQLARPNNNRAVAKQEAKSTDLTDNYFLRLKVILWTLVTCEQQCRREVNQTITNYVIIECMSYELNHFSWKFHSFQRAHSQ